MLRRFWFEFDVSGSSDLPAGIRMGCGVTAHTHEDAGLLVQERVFRGASLPPITQLVPDVDVSTLDPGHVRPNMGNPAVRGIWFPLGY
jgi:hypothetical protein